MKARKDRAYWERNQVVALLCKMSLALGYLVWRTRTDIEDWDASWHNCVYIGLPTGQVSWHYHDSDMETFAFVPDDLEIAYDGHSTDEKYERVKECEPFNVYKNDAIEKAGQIARLREELEVAIDEEQGG